MKKLPLIRVGDQVFGEEGGTEFGAVRKVGIEGKPEIMIYVENAGDFVVPLKAVTAVHDGKVLLAVSRLDQAIQDAIAEAHRAEDNPDGIPRPPD